MAVDVSVNTMLNPITSLRLAVASLSDVPDKTPVEPTLAYGAPNALIFDDKAGVVRLSVGWGSATGRPTMGQLRAWLGLPPGKNGLAGPWASARGLENIFTWRGALVMVSAIASGYHGVKRNNGSVWSGLVWFAAGALFPPVSLVVAAAQGFAKPVRVTCQPLPTVRALV